MDLANYLLLLLVCNESKSSEKKFFIVLSFVISQIGAQWLKMLLSFEISSYNSFANTDSYSIWSGFFGSQCSDLAAWRYACPCSSWVAQLFLIHG